MDKTKYNKPRWFAPAARSNAGTLQTADTSTIQRILWPVVVVGRSRPTALDGGLASSDAPLRYRPERARLITANLRSDV